VPPGFRLLGLAEQLTVGGSYARTAKLAEHSALSPGFRPSLPGLPSFTAPFTV